MLLWQNSRMVEIEIWDPKVNLEQKVLIPIILPNVMISIWFVVAGWNELWKISGSIQYRLPHSSESDTS